MRKISKEDSAHYLEEARGLERDYLSEVLESRRSWRTAAMVSWGISALLVCGYIGLIPLKEKVPVILRVDNSTGFVDILSTLDEIEKTRTEVDDKYWLSQYVLHREGYDYETIQASYEATGLLSTPQVQKEYYALFDGPKARDKALGNQTKIIADVRSIIPNQNSNTAQVRFTTQMKELDGNSGPVQHWIATIGYQYASGPMRDSDRLINPLGFQVRSYRVDPEKTQ